MADGEVFDPQAEVPLKSIGARVRELRLESGLSQVQLAEAMRAAGHENWRQNTVSRVERDEQEPPVEEIASLERLIGPVLAGTKAGLQLQLAARGIGNAAQRVAMQRSARALGEAERRLLASRAELDYALDVVRMARVPLDGRYASQNPELLERWDARHGEH